MSLANLLQQLRLQHLARHAVPGLHTLLVAEFEVKTTEDTRTAGLRHGGREAVVVSRACRRRVGGHVEDDAIVAKEAGERVGRRGAERAVAGPVLGCSAN